MLIKLGFIINYYKYAEKWNFTNSLATPDLIAHNRDNQSSPCYPTFGLLCPRSLKTRLGLPTSFFSDN